MNINEPFMNINDAGTVRSISVLVSVRCLLEKVAHVVPQGFLSLSGPITVNKTC